MWKSRVAPVGSRAGSLTDGRNLPRILVIDDDDALRETLCEEFAEAGFHVDQAADGREALAAFRRAPTDVVVTDIFMPEMDGIELLITLRRLHPDVRLIAISGGDRHSVFDYLPAAETLGAVRTVKKPFKAADLVRIVRKMLDGSEQSS